jgi:hypothetical protein
MNLNTIISLPWEARPINCRNDLFDGMEIID